MNYNICGVPITKEHALRIAECTYRIMRDFPSGNRVQDNIDLDKARNNLNDVKRDIKSGGNEND
jgi:hypothetical protein